MIASPVNSAAAMPHPLRLPSRVGEPPKSPLLVKKLTYLQPKMGEIAELFKSAIDSLNQVAPSPDKHQRFTESRQQRLKKHFVLLAVQFQRFAKLLRFS